MKDERVCRFRVSGMLLLFLLLLVFPAGSVQAEEKSAGKELNIALGNLPLTMDPQMVSDSSSYQYLNPGLGFLMRYGEDGELFPELAESYEMSEDGLTYTFHLRDGICYADGAPVTADDFVFAFRRVADPKTASPAVFFIEDVCIVKNAEEVTAGELPPEKLGVSAPDPKTFVVELTKPCPYFLSVLTQCCTSPCNEQFFLQCNGKYATSPDTMRSCGPFIVDRYEPLSLQVHYRKNPAYVRADEVSLQGISFRQIANVQQAVMVYETGQADLILISGDFLALTKGDPNLHSKSGGLLSYFLGNFKKCSAWNNRDIRQAFSMALDRDTIVRNYYHSNGQSLTRLIPEGLMKEPDGTDFGKDKDRYRRLCGFDKDAALEHWEKGLKELGISKLRVELLTSPDEQLMEIIEDQLESTLPGLDLVIRTVTMSQLINLTMNGDFELVSARWGADYPDANSFLSLFYSKGTMDYSSYESAGYDALVERSLMETDPEERVKLLHRAEDLLMEDLPFIPFYSPGQSWMIRENVKNVCIDFTGLLIDPSFAVKE